MEVAPLTEANQLGRTSIVLAIVGYLSPIALLAIDGLLFLVFSRELSGVFLYYDMIVAIACVVLAAMLLRLPWPVRLVVAILAVTCFLVEIFVLAMLAIALTGLEGIQ